MPILVERVHCLTRELLLAAGTRIAHLVRFAESSASEKSFPSGGFLPRSYVQRSTPSYRDAVCVGLYESAGVRASGAPSSTELPFMEKPL